MLKDEKLYYVGGVVRDELLGIENTDTDYCYEGNALDFTKTLNILKINSEFGTIRLNILGEEIDIASTRTESYPRPGHLPHVEKIGCSLEEDMKRRDFTINAMAKNTLTGKFFDYFNGKEDLQNKKLRALHEKSFIDDPTRIVRALKFSVRLGFTLDKDTLDLQKEYLENVNYDMSYHRLKKELSETLLNDTSYQLFVENDIYKLLGERQPDKSFLIKNIPDTKNINNSKKWLIYLSPFNLSNFNFSKKETQIIESSRSCTNS